MSKREDLLRKVRALVAKANGTVGEEAMAFLNKAQAWMIEYDIDAAELAAGTAPDYMVLDAPAAAVWEERVHNAIAKLYFCRYFVLEIHGKQVHSYCGEEHHVVVAKQMADYIVAAIHRLAQPGIRARKGEEARLYDASFCHQASVGIALRIKERILATLKGQATDETGTTLPALLNQWNKTQAEIDEFLAQQFGDATRQKLSTQRHDPEGLRDGEAAGEQIGLDPQVAATNKGLLK